VSLGEDLGFSPLRLPQSVPWYFPFYLSRYLDQETVKWPFRFSESSCHLLLPV